MSTKNSPSEEEEKYFKQEEIDAKKRLQFQKQLNAIRQTEREGIAEVLNTNEDVAQEALELGFDIETARVLPMVPIIQMAWADGKVTMAESKQVVKLAAQYGIEENTPAHEFLKALLAEHPSELFFERVNRVVQHLVEETPEDWLNRNVVELSRTVAEASGGFFGLKNPINEQEARLLEEFAKIFTVEKNAATKVLSSSESDQ